MHAQAYFELLRALALATQHRQLQAVAYAARHAQSQTSIGHPPARLPTQNPLLHNFCHKLALLGTPKAKRMPPPLASMRQDTPPPTPTAPLPCACHQPGPPPPPTAVLSPDGAAFCNCQQTTQHMLLASACPQGPPPPTHTDSMPLRLCTWLMQLICCDAPVPPSHAFGRMR